MHKRRDFLEAVGATTAIALIHPYRAGAETIGDSDRKIPFRSSYMELASSSTAPELVTLNVDGLGKGRRGANIIGKSGSSGTYPSNCLRLTRRPAS